MSTSGSPDATTAAAASGSAQRLNSARGPTLPRSWIAPPMATIRPMRFAASGCSRTSRARFVSGPRAKHIDGAGRLPEQKIRKPFHVAGRRSGSRIGVGQGYAADAVGPVQVQRLRSWPRQGRGRAEKTGISSRPAKARSRPALRVVVSMPMLPGNRRDPGESMKLGRNQRQKDRRSHRRFQDPCR